LCTSRRRRHRGLPSACAWRPHFHAISGQLVLSTRRSWSKSISPITCKSFPKRKKMTKKTKNADRNQRENCNLETRIPFMETGHTVRPPCAHRGSAGAAAGITRVRHAHILTCDTLTRARDRRSRARRFGARGPRQTAMGVQLNIFWKNRKTNTVTHAVPAPCDLVRRSLHGVSASRVPVTSSRRHSQPKHGVSVG
jgi:hypothetical protein